MMGTGTKHAEAVIAWLAELVTIIGSGPAVLPVVSSTPNRLSGWSGPGLAQGWGSEPTV